MNRFDRREFLAGLGSAALVGGWTDKKSVIGGSPSLTNGTTRLAFSHGEKGWGFVVESPAVGARPIATSSVPIRCFYDTRGSGPVTDVLFDTVSVNGKTAHAHAEFTDAKTNRWRVTMAASPAAKDGITCQYTYELISGNADGVFFEHNFVPDMPGRADATYVLMPGLLYDGNHQTKTPNQIAQLSEERKFRVDTPIPTLAFPVSVSFEKKSGRTFMLIVDPTTDVGMNGFTYVLRPDEHRVAAMTPVYREEHLYHANFRPEAPIGAKMHAGEKLRVSVTCLASRFPDLLSMFAAMEQVRTFCRTPFTRNHILPLSAAGKLVEMNMNDRMWCESSGFYCNAMPPTFDIHASGCKELPPDWQLQTGWCAGSATGYALLKVGDSQSRARAIRMLDLISNGGTSPSGLQWSIYYNDTWDPELGNSSVYQHLRMPADGAFFAQKALYLERSRGTNHPTWETLVVHNLDAFVKLWQQHGQFGHKVDRQTLAITDPDTAAGALCIGALALGHQLPRGHEYLHTAEAAAEMFFDQYVRKGWIVGGPLDIPNAPDSESVFALLESYVTLYEVTKSPKYLRYAQDVLHHVGTWVVAYNASLPTDSFGTKNKIQTTGGVLANSQNHHIGPSFCTHSGDALLRLYEYTGESRALQLLEDVVGGLPQYVCTGKEVGYQIMKPGMVTEQFNMSDEIRPRGAIWEICTSWAATCMLLSAGEVPSVYVDRAQKTIAVFDHLDATPDWKKGTLRLANTTAYPAHVSVRRRNGAPTALELAPGEQQTMTL